LATENSVMVTSRHGPCLLCTAPAIIADWTPMPEWLSVEGCGCGGFFISKDLWNLRLVSMRVPEREELAERLRTGACEGTKPG
jgi:hypothetical protein